MLGRLLPRPRRPRRDASVRLDALEGRQYLSYTPLGYSLPDLSVAAYAAPAGSYGQPISLVLDVRNEGASSIAEPLAFVDPRSPGDPAVPYYNSHADAPASTLQVWISPKPRFDADAVPLDPGIAIPAIPQNDIIRVLATIPADPTDPVGSRRHMELPPNVRVPEAFDPNAINAAPEVVIPPLSDLPAYFPATGTLYLYFQVDSTNNVAENNENNNLNMHGVPVSIVDALPDINAVGLDVARGLAPGDLVTPNLKLINYGTVGLQGQILPVNLETARGDVFAEYDVDEVLPITKAPTRRVYPGLKNLDDPANVRYLPASVNNPAAPAGPYTRLPNSLNGYRFGVRVDPGNVVNQLTGRKGLQQVRQVGQPLRGVGPVNVVANPAVRPLSFPHRRLPS